MGEVRIKWRWPQIGAAVTSQGCLPCGLAPPFGIKFEYEGFRGPQKAHTKVAVKRWGDDTHALLDHVYFETEPMDKVQRGQLFDFGKARPPERPSEIAMRQLPRDKIQEGKKLLAAMKEKLARGQALAKKLVADQVIDEPYLAAMEYLEDEDLALGLTGRAEIKESETLPSEADS